MDKQGRIVVVVGESPLLRVSVVSANTQPSGPTDNRFVEYVINVSIPKFTAIGDTTTATTTTATGTSTGTSTDTAAYCTKATRGGRSNGFSWSEQEGGEAFDESWRRWHEEEEEEREHDEPKSNVVAVDGSVDVFSSQVLDVIIYVLCSCFFCSFVVVLVFSVFRMASATICTYINSLTSIRTAI
eukprot:GHVS01026344.1.p1 GENE.GHVS01026344.1~~GHVS01026344.1.p1  ORF type:complete len:185 (+),score=28.96 GHVS01026344.1:89-643(+)